MKHIVALALLGTSVLILATGSADAQGRQVRRTTRPLADRYIVVLRGAEDPESVGVESAQLRRGRLRHVYRRAIRGFAIQLSPAAARALANDPRVAYVEEDGLVTADTTVQSGATWGLDRLDQRALPLNSQYSYDFDGTGVNAYVIDTGIRPTHTEFGGRAFIAGDFVDDDLDGDPNDVADDDATPGVPDGNDCHGHGTHVAGTIGGATYGVAKNVTLWALRVLDCTGSGSTSSVIAAVDAITDSGQRPSVVNMSLGGPPSAALDAAIQRSIAAGFTYVVAAGNSTADASTSSPARVPEAITVGATGTNDARASFSNFGPLLDLFAPGVSIRSASFANDTASVTMSGTSMASPHVAGLAALYLQTHGSASPSSVRDAIVSAATPGVVVSAGPGSPTLLAYSPIAAASTPPSVTVLTPNGGEKVFSTAPYVIEWFADDPDGLASFSVEVSTNNGTSYSPIPGCSSLAGDVRRCTWTNPGPASTTARVRVNAKDAFGALASDASDAPFTIGSGSGMVTVTSPNTALNWGRGSRQVITWTHNLGLNSLVRIEISRDGGVTYSEIAPSVKNSGAAAGAYEWVVSGPNTSTAIIRVSGIAGGAVDTSNVPFTIAEPYILVPKPTAGTSWGFGTLQRLGWQTNLGPGDQVNVLLSSDGGQSFPTAVAAGIKATTFTATFATPVLGSPTTSARMRVVWANPPAGVTLATTSPANFRIEAPFVRVTTPNGGETWTVGTSAAIRWEHNLSDLEMIRIDLSTDDGLTYPITVIASTPSDAAHAAVPVAAWITGTARIRLAWVKDAAAADVSNAAFRIQ
jgi:subtilisin family serine protease